MYHPIPCQNCGRRIKELEVNILPGDFIPAFKGLPAYDTHRVLCDTCFKEITEGPHLPSDVVQTEKIENPYTEEENCVYENLIDWGFVVERQKGFPWPSKKEMRGWIHVDLAIPKYLLAVEVDGKHHGEDPQKTIDFLRQYSVQMAGYRYYRIPNEDLYDEERLAEHLERIEHLCQGTDKP